MLKAFLLIGAVFFAHGTLAQAPIVVGSKRFTESYVLGEIARETLQRQGIAAQHKQGLGNTGILEAALASVLDRQDGVA